MNVLSEHGRIVVLKKDGTEGAFFDITREDIIIGRDANCDIRIKLPSVSRKHVRIYLDENGEVCSIIDNFIP